MSQLMTEELTRDEPKRRYVTLEPGALHDVPMVAFVLVASAFELRAVMRPRLAANKERSLS